MIMTGLSETQTGIIWGRFFPALCPAAAIAVVAIIGGSRESVSAIYSRDQ